MTDAAHQFAAHSRRCIIPLLTLFAIVAGAAALAACSTTEGFGEDVKNLGSNIEDSAAKNK